MCGDGRKLTVHDFDIESNYKISIKDLIKINSSKDDLILGKLSYTENPSVETDSV